VPDVADLNRGLHFAASLLPAGALVFLTLLAAPATAGAGPVGDLRSRLRLGLRAAVVVAFATGVVWLAAEAVSMSGTALSPRLLVLTLTSTSFGQVWLVRAVVLAALALWAFRARGAVGDDGVGLALSVAFAVTLAWIGHPVGTAGAAGAVLLTSQAVHLVAAAGWLGALLPLALALAAARREPAMLPFAAAVTRRFSYLGMICVLALLASGLVNSWLLVGTIPQLFGTAYGHVLLMKVALFLAMLGFAAVNRFHWTPRLEIVPQSVRRLGRNAIVELGLGLGILALVGALGATPPAAHEQPLWPFSFTFSTAPILLWDGRLDPDALTALAIAGAGLALTIVAAVWRRHVLAVLGVMAAIGGSVHVLASMVVPAYPTSFMRSPVPFAADAIVHGARTYADHCVACHGAEGLGDGPAAASLNLPSPPTLVGHLTDHPDGELFWWISNGIPGRPMPSFAAEIPPRDRWALIQYLRAQADASICHAMAWRIDPELGDPAPDFSFQIGDGAPETLVEQRGRANILLVLYSRPGSDARLRQLAAARPELYGTRVIAIPIGDDTAAPAGMAEMLAHAPPDVVEAYAIADPQRRKALAAGHVEYLIDRAGFVRARWSPADGEGWHDLAELKAQIAAADRMPFRPVELPAHVHGG